MERLHSRLLLAIKLQLEPLVKTRCQSNLGGCRPAISRLLRRSLHQTSLLLLPPVLVTDMYRSKRVHSPAEVMLLFLSTPPLWSFLRETCRSEKIRLSRL